MTSLLLALWLLVAPDPPETAGREARSGVPLTVMTFNLRYASEIEQPRWSERRDLAAATIRRESPDVVGTQEGLYDQLRDLEERLDGYRWIGLGREGGSRGEHMAIFYRTARLEPLEYDHFWLSPTPRVIGSRCFDATLPRMVTWVRFRERETDREMVVANTHFDHESQIARERSAHLLRDWAAGVERTTPCIVTGDFNAEARRNLVYGLLVDDDQFDDTFVTAREAGEDHGTFHGFSGTPWRRGRIDWILTRGPWSCERAAIVTLGEDDRWPSDHFPVVARLRLPP